MKHLLSILTLILMVSCYTPTVNQTHIYGTVESKTTLNNKFKYKVWCAQKGKYYYVLSSNLYQRNELILIK